MRKIKGRVLFVDGDCLLLARGDRLLKSEDGGISWSNFHVAHDTFFKRILMKSHVISRFLRLGFHHVVVSPAGGYFVFVNKFLYKIDSAGAAFGRVVKYKGSRPLKVCSLGDSVYYGEYCSNPDRSAVSVYAFDSTTHNKFSEISGVRHIHGVFYDPYENCLWMTTGDYGDEAGIWKFDGAMTAPVLTGGQQSRAVQLLFDESYVYFGTDTPLENNYIKRFCRASKRVENLCEVSSSIFYGAHIGDRFFFATVAEPSEVNTVEMVQLWGSNGGKKWTLLGEYRKDILPMKLFQYGQIIFPQVSPKSSYLWFYKMGVAGSGYSFRREFDAVDA